MKERLAAWAKDIERELSGFCEPEAPEYEEFSRMLGYGLLGGGKRLRGGLLLAAYETMGGDGEDGEALRYAAALECIHAFSLIHDDLPSMDDADTRRGKPAHHKAYGEGMAVLSGDALLAIAAERMIVKASEAMVFERMKRRVDAARAVLTAAGMRGIAVGQYLDMVGTGSVRWKDGGIEDRAALLEDIDRRKTAEMFRAAAEAGFRLAGASESEIEAAVSFGLKLGMLYQLRDDLQDADTDKGQITWPVVYGINESKRKAEEWERAALAALWKLGGRGAPLAQFVEMMREFA
ncbi:MAG: polyprenyl synthetase family protein [Oscillospiraceae bacterium]|jgi:geranylgeranyl pyrophosphate synthase|nr:polyprenyl synthetase family protein [Oscillospiraceae bacterium]